MAAHAEGKTKPAQLRTARESHSLGRRLYGLLALARISNSPTVVSNVLAGAALAGALAPDGRIAMLALSMVLFYTGGMYLNDICDYSRDLHERPERPLPAGLISRWTALFLMLALFGCGIALLVPLGLPALMSGIALIGLIVAYDLWHKTNPLSPLLMAGCRLLVYVTTFLALAATPTWQLALAGAALLLYLIGLTYIAKWELRDSLVGYWPAALLFLPMALFVLRPLAPWQLPLVLVAVYWVGDSISHVYRPHGRNLGRAIGQLIAGISLVDALVIAALGYPFGVIAALAAFVLTLLLQRFIKGT